MRFHVLSLPHTHTTSKFNSCAYTNKVRNFCAMMRILGYEVFLYSGEKNEANCTEHISCISEKSRKAAVGDRPYTSASFNVMDPHWMEYNHNAIREIEKRIQPRDFICAIAGWSHKPIADHFPGNMTVEFGIGYAGHFSKYRVFESYAWMHMNYGALAANGKGMNGLMNYEGSWIDTVIPGYLEPEKFPNAEKPKSYILFVGRVIPLKGIDIVMETCKIMQVPLIIAGPCDDPDWKPLWGKYVGPVGEKKRAKLMSEARALFCPTRYIEPFGNVAVEAQACGTPVVSTDWGAFAETVENGLTGFRCRTTAEFINALRSVHGLDRDYIRKRAQDNYSVRYIAHEYEAYFERLMLLWEPKGLGTVNE